MRAHLRFSAGLAALGLAVSANAWAQAQARAPAQSCAASTPPSACGRPAAARARPAVTERVEHIHLEDSGSRVDEVRIGGQTRSITVQPKANVPAYDVRPAGATYLARPESGPGSAGQRTWRVFSF
jgi:hypothetical protein